ncbi:MAG: PKD domain-containing protein, partial [Planctomycetota bacterium]
MSATDQSEADPTSIVGSIGGIAVNVAFADTSLTRTTESAIESGSSLTLGGTGSLFVQADSAATSNSKVSSGAFGGVAASVLNIDSTIDGTTRAKIDSSAIVNAAGGNVVVQSTSTNQADAATESLSFGLVEFGTSNPTSTIDSTNEALSLGDVTATNLSVAASSDDATTTSSSSIGGGLVSVGLSNVNATTTPTVTATVGGSINVSGNLEVTSSSVTDADASSDTKSGGVLAVTRLESKVTAEPTVSANVASGAVLSALGDVVIRASHGVTPPPTSNGSFDGQTGVSVGDDTIRFSANHGLFSGSSVVYQPGTETAVGGLVDGRRYGILTTDDGQSLQLGETFESSDVDLVSDLITFTTPHRFATGDLVRYQPNSGSAVGGLSNASGPYRVTVIDNNTIKLAEAVPTANAPVSFSGLDIASDTITSASHGFTDSQPVTYRGPQATSFSLIAVDVVGGAGAEATESADNDNVLLLGHDFQAGDEVIYSTDRPGAIGGLVDGQRYFVIVDPAKPNEIQLAATRDQAIGVDANGNDPAIPITAIALTPSDSDTDTDAVLSFRKASDQLMGGLSDGVTYYIANRTDDTYQLAMDPSGTSIVSISNVDPADGTTVLTGTHSFGTEGVDLTNQGSGSHRLVLDLTSVGSGSQTFDGIGGARSLTAAPSGDGIPTASASGVGGGLIESGASTTTAIAKPTVNATVGGGAEISATTIDIDAKALTFGSAVSASDGGGLVSIKTAIANLEINGKANVDIMAATLSARDSVTIDSLSQINASAYASSTSGGFVDVSDADVTASVDFTSDVTIGSGTTISADNNIHVESSSDVTIVAESSLDSSGAGSSADTSVDLDVGSQTQRGATTTTIGAGAKLTSEVIDVIANAKKLDLTAEAISLSGGVFAGAVSKSELDIFDEASLLIDSGAELFAADVGLVAKHESVAASSIANADGNGLHADATATARGNLDSVNSVTAASGAKVSAGILDVQSTQGNGAGQVDLVRTTIADTGALGTPTTSTPGEFKPSREIDWNANVNFLSSPTPQLEIGPDGAIVIARGVTVQGADASSDPIRIDPIQLESGAIANFVVDATLSSGSPTQATSATNRLTGSGGQFSRDSVFPQVDIVNRSDKDLVLDDITMGAALVQPTVNINADQSDTFTFDIAGLDIAGGAPITVLNQGSGDVRIGGVIDNPLGSILIENRQGSILVEGNDEEALRALTVGLQAAGSIGQAGLSVPVDLVAFVGGPSRFDADSDGDIHIDFTGLWRDPTDPIDAHFELGHVVSGGDVDLSWNETRREITPGGTDNGILVSLNGAAPTAFQYRYQPDSSQPAPDLDFRVFPDVGAAELIDGRFRFETITGKNIRLTSNQVASGSVMTHVTSLIDHADDGKLDAKLTGEIRLNESTGDIRIGTIHSTQSNVFLETNDPAGSIIEVNAGDNGGVPFVLGNQIWLKTEGSIGRVNDLLEMDSSFSGDGRVDALAGQNVYVSETAGDMVLSAALARQMFGEVLIEVLDGSLLDFEDDTDPSSQDFLRADIQASRIDLIIRGGGVGTVTNDLEIYGGGFNQAPNTGLQVDPTDGVSRPGPGRLWVDAEDDVRLMQVAGAINVLSVTSASGDIELRAKDGAFEGSFAGGEIKESIIVSAAGGQSLQGASVSSGKINAAGNVVLSAGDDVLIPAGTSITAGSVVEINGDSGSGIISADTIGSTITLAGDIHAQTVMIGGGPQIDHIEMLRSGSVNAPATINGGGSRDNFYIQYADQPLTINGQTGDDVFYFGSDASVTNVGGNILESIGGDLKGINAAVTVNTGPGTATVPNVVYLSTAGSESSVAGSLDGGTFAGLGMTGSINVTTPDNPTTDEERVGATVVLGLSDFDDQFEIKSLSEAVFLSVQAGLGDDTLNVGKTNRSVVGVDGVIGFFGEGGDGDVLNVYGDATDANRGGQLTGIGVTGLGMGRNLKFTTHNDVFGADLDVKDANDPGDDPDNYPAAIYYGLRDRHSAGQPIVSTVESVNVILGSGDDRFDVDSTYDYGVTNVDAGPGNDVIRVGSTATGLRTVEVRDRVDFIDGRLNLVGGQGTNTVIVNDAEDDDVAGNTGVFLGDTISGLDNQGLIEFKQFNTVEVRLGKTADEFYVPALDADQSLWVRGGLGGDRFFVGSSPNGVGGSLQKIAGQLRIDGDQPSSLDRLFINDQSMLSGRQYTVSNEPIVLADGGDGDITTVTRADRTGLIRYTTVETVVLSTGSGNDVIDLNATHREQSNGGASTFTINAGDGADLINVGDAVTEGFSLERFAIDLNTLTDVGGIRVFVNGQGGEDTVHYLNTALSDNQSLALNHRTFDEILPPDPNADPSSLELFTEIFGDDPERTPYSEVVLSSATDLTVNELTGTLNPTFDLSTRATGGTFDLRVTIQPDIEFELFAIPFDLDADALRDRIFVASGGNVSANVTSPAGPMLNGWKIEFPGVSGEVRLTADPLKLTQSPPLNINSRLTENIEVSLGGGDDVIQLVSGVYQTDLIINTGEGVDTFVVEPGVDSRGHEIRLNGQGGDDVLFLDFRDGAPAGTIESLVFDGGANDDFGDKFRIGGDGNLAGGTYTPSQLVARAGQVDLAGNRFEFLEVEPLVVHGLADFHVIHPEQAAVLDLESIAVEDLQLRNLELHVLTVDGVVSWNPLGGDLNLLDVPTNDPKHLGQATDTNGNTLVVGSSLDGAEYGAAYVYDWNGTGQQWDQIAKLLPGDRDQFGQDFGNSVAINEAGDVLVVGAPGDDESRLSTQATQDQSGAVYVFEKAGGNWSQVAKLKGDNVQAFSRFGEAVAISGTTIVVGAPGAQSNSDFDHAYVFNRIGSNWTQSQSRGNSGTDYGRAVDISGSRIVVGVPGKFNGGFTGGSVLATDGRSLTTSQSFLTASEPQAGERFGDAVSIDEARVVVGAPQWDDDGNDEGRAFVFDLIDSEYVRVARLTADDGLPQSDSTDQGNVNDRFGTSVDVSGDYVVVGAPLVDSTSGNSTIENGGAAYVFYESPPVDSGLGSTWVRSSGPTGSGRLQATKPESNGAQLPGTASEFQTADRFGTSVTIGGGRIVAGVPGHNEATSDDNGGFHTFVTDGVLPAVTNEILRAETITDSNASSNFGSRTLYDEASRTLFVASPSDVVPESNVKVYVNEGLSWRLVQTINSPFVNGKFGTDMAIDDDLLVIGAPGVQAGFAGRVFVYERTGETFTHRTDIFDERSDISFGTSVDVEGDRIAVGVPNADVGYSTQGQSGFVNLFSPGNALVYKRESVETWSLERRLFPSDGKLPTESDQRIPIAIQGAGEAFGFSETDFGGTRNDFRVAQPESLSAVSVGASTRLTLIDEGGLFEDSGYIEILNSNQGNDNFYALPLINFSDSSETLPAGITVRILARDIFGVADDLRIFGPGSILRYDLSIFDNDINRGVISLLDVSGDGPGMRGENTTIGVPNANTPGVTDPISSYQGVFGDRWGTSVTFLDDNTVIVGAPGNQGRFASYDLSDSSDSGFQAGFPGGGALSGKVLLPKASAESPVSLGTELVKFVPGTFLGSAPESNRIDLFFESQGQLLSFTSVPIPNGAARFGDANTLAASGFVFLLGAPGTPSGSSVNPGTAYLGAGVEDLELRPFRFNGSQLEDDPANRNFGVGTAIISEGHYVVGTESSEILYNFRRRGPAWNVIGEITVPEPIPRSLLGYDIAIDGDTAVLGAPDYDGTGAVFVYRNDGTQWNLESVLQGDGIGLGDHFGTGVAISGDTIAVGAPGAARDLRGQAYVFERVGTQWRQSDQIDAPSQTDAFARSLAIDVDTLVIGDFRVGEAYVYGAGVDGWSLDETLSSELGFGFDVDIDGNRILVGNPIQGDSNGHAKVFVNETGQWVEESTLEISNSGFFGFSVSISDQTLLVGAPRENDDTGAAYVFEFDSQGNSWAMTDELLSEAPMPGDVFGYSVDLGSMAAVIGAPARNRNDLDGVLQENAGAAFVFGRDKEGDWKNETSDGPIGPASPIAFHNVGFSVGITSILEIDPVTGEPTVAGEFVLAGAPQADDAVGDNKDSDGIGYAFQRDLAPPTTVTVPVLQETLIAGAQANRLSGTVGGVETSTLNFFDITDVTIETGAFDDQFTLHDEGLTAYGLAKLLVKTHGGDDVFNVYSNQLTPTADGTVIRGGSFGDAAAGDALPDGASNLVIEGDFTFDAGGGSNEILADNQSAGNDTNFDWKLQSDRLSSGDESVSLVGFDGTATLLGGDAGNKIEALSWPGTVIIDGRGGSDQFRVNLGGLTRADVMETPGAGSNDQLIAVGTPQDDVIFINGNAINIGTRAANYSGIESVRVFGDDGDDTLALVDVVPGTRRVLLDGGKGSDVHEIAGAISDDDVLIEVSDSGPPQIAGVGDFDSLKLPVSLSQNVNVPFSIGSATAVYDSSIESLAVMPINFPPQNASAGGDQTVAEGTLVSLLGTFTDPNANDMHQYFWNVTAENGDVIPNGTSQDFQFTPGDNGTYVVQFTVTDFAGASSTDSVTIEVNNRAPAVRDVVATPILEGETTFVTGVIDDPGHLDTLTVEIDWGNGIETLENVSPGPFSFSREFLDDNPSASQRDDMPIRITVVDDD